MADASNDTGGEYGSQESERRLILRRRSLRDRRHPGRQHDPPLPSFAGSRYVDAGWSPPFPKENTMLLNVGRLIDHVHLRVADADAGKRFYGAGFDALGLSGIMNEGEGHFQADDR